MNRIKEVIKKQRHSHKVGLLKNLTRVTTQLSNTLTMLDSQALSICTELQKN